MGLRINTNMAAISAFRNMSRPQNMLRDAMEKLSSGQRINKAADDAAGLAIASRMQAETRSLSQAVRNASDGVSLAQTAEGAQNQVSDMTGRIRELSVQAANGTLSGSDREAIQGEIDGLTAEIDRISQSTEFNGQKLLDGNYSAQLQVGEGASDTIQVDIQSTSTAALGLDTIDVTTPQGAQAAISAADQATDRVSSNRAELGSLQNRLGSAVENLQSYRENLEEARSRIMDADMAVETANLAKGQVLAESTISVMSQANVSPQGALRLL